MTLTELIDAVDGMKADAAKNGVPADSIEVKTITDRGAVKRIKGWRAYDVRVNGPVLLTR